MSSIKILPPTRLEEGELSEADFQIFKTELEVYLEADTKYAIFLQGGNYHVWRSQEQGGERIVALHADDEAVIENDVNILPGRKQAEKVKKLNEIQRLLRLFISLVAKCVTKNQYMRITRQCTSLDSVFTIIRRDYDIQARGIHFLNIVDLKYDDATMTPTGFHDQIRTVVTNNLGEGERLGKAFEDFIFVDALRRINPKLPAHIKRVYAHKIGDEQRIHDYKHDIFVNLKTLIAEMEDMEQLSSIRVGGNLSYMQTQSQRGGYGSRDQARQSYPASRGGANRGGVNNRGGTMRGGSNRRGGPGAATDPNNQTPKSYNCYSCYSHEYGRSTFNSHRDGDKICPSGSAVKMNHIEGQDEGEEYSVEEQQEQEADPTVQLKKVKPQLLNPLPELNIADQPRLGYIKPEPSQIMTVYQDREQTNPIHLDLDSGAFVSYIRKSEAIARGFKIRPNGQMSTLGDGNTLLPPVGEVHETFYRNDWSVLFRAVVVEKLVSPTLAGNPFTKDNVIVQDLNKGTISVHDGKHVIMDTRAELLMPINTKPQVKQDNEKPAYLQNIEQRLGSLLPGQTLEQDVKMKSNQVVLVEGWLENKTDWPHGTLCHVANGKISLTNNTQEPITLGRKGQVKTLKISKLEDHAKVAEQVPPDYYTRKPILSASSNPEQGKANLKKVSFGKDIEKKVLELIDAAHEEFSDVFDECLTGGYNGYFGPHECKLNWVSKDRPQANKIKVANYNHALNGLMQEVCDDLTDQNVMGIPQEMPGNVIVQSVCPSFLKRKKRAKNKPIDQLTKDDMRLLVNFGPVNEKIKDVPTPMTTPDDVFNMMGRFKYIIVFDLYNGFYQNHMSADSIPWLGIMTPFGGLRVLRRSGQGLLGQSEEFNLLIKKIIKEELKAGKCCQLIDDVVVGGNTQEEAANNYIDILRKFHLANIKVSAKKTHIFPKQLDILGWVWHLGGRLEPSPHRRNALVNTKQEDLKKVKDVRSWLGLYKTLRRATPTIHNILDSLEQAVSDKPSTEHFVWTHELEKRFREAKSAIKDMHTLYLPDPNDQLLMTPDGAVKTPGVGHVLFAVKGEERLPVRFHSVKLPEGCKKWSPCEVEALAFATGIEAEYDLIRESKKPLLICPDSKVVADAVKLIKQGKYSASSRINRFITNVNKVKLEVHHVSGKAKLNLGGDNQSRMPSECTSELCTICRFVTDQIDTVVDPAAKCAAVQVLPDLSMESRQMWRKVQKADPACKEAIRLLSSGKTPNMTKTGDEANATRWYCREATVSKDDILVVHQKADAKTGELARDKVVVPQSHVNGVLYELHNSEQLHPSKAQMKHIFQRRFACMLLDQFLTKLYDNCYECSKLQRLPRTVVQQESKAVVEHPHTYFHADVIKRAGQNIFLLVDHFSSAQSSIMVPSEKAADLKQALLILLQSMRKPGWIEVNVDNAKGFESLVKQQDSDLTRLKIKLNLTDVFNKNANSVVDKACQELEEELRKVSPGGHPLTQAQLSQAVMLVNQKLRRGGGLSSHEISTSRDMHTGQNLQLHDDLLRKQQLETREVQHKHHGGQQKVQPLRVGDRVAVLQQQDKHKARDVYRVTTTDGEEGKVEVQKEWKGKLRSKVYRTDEKRLVPIGQGSSIPFKAPEVPPPRKTYDPVNQALWQNEEDDIFEEAPEILWKDGVQFERQQEPIEIEVEEAAAVHDLPLVEEQQFQQMQEPEDHLLDEAAGEVAAEHVAVEEEDHGYDQSRKPKRGDIISYGIEMGKEHERWAEARITSVSRYPHYYNIRRLDTNELLGVFLYPDTAWHLGPRLEHERAPMLQNDSLDTSDPVRVVRREEREFVYAFEVEELFDFEPLEESLGLGEDRQ